MNDLDWTYFIFGLIAWQLIKILAMAINNAVIEHRQKRFLKLVNIKFPDNKNLTFISIDASDRRAMRDLERQLQEQFNLPEDDLPHPEGLTPMTRQR